MKKFFKGTAEVASMALVLTGFIVCACETEALDKQILVCGIGFGMIVVGALGAVLVNGGGKNADS